MKKSHQNRLFITGFLSAVLFSIGIAFFWHHIPDPNLNMSGLERTLRSAVDQATSNLRAHNPYDYSATGLPWAYSEVIFPFRWASYGILVAAAISLATTILVWRKD